MSYCRFSSENWMCDVYVYEDVMGGWTTHVAGRRPQFAPIPELPIRWLPDLGGQWDRAAREMVYPSRWRKVVARVFSRIWIWSHELSLWSLERIPLRTIGLAHDGDRFNHATPGECAQQLASLAAMGYRVPGRVIQALMDEQADLDKQGAPA